MKKKMLVLTSTFPRWKNDEVPMFVYEWCQEMAKYFDVYVLAPYFKGSKRYEKMGSLEVHRFRYAFHEKLTEKAILPTIKYNPFTIFQVPGFVISELTHAYRLAKKNDVDSICSHWLIPQGLNGAIVSKLTNKSHNVIIHAAGLMTLKRIPGRKIIANFIARNSDNLICVSSYLAKELKKLIKKKYYDKIKIISMGIYVNNYHRKMKKFNKFTVLFLGRLAEKKGVKYLIEAVKGLDCDLLIAGTGPLERKLKVYAKNMDNVKFIGWVTGNEKIKYLNKSHVLVLPGISVPGDIEGLPLVILEAFAAGTPVVASDVGGVTDIVKDRETGLLVREKDSEDIRRKLLMLMKSDKLYKNLSGNAKKTVENYNWEKIGRSFSEILS